MVIVTEAGQVAVIRHATAAATGDNHISRAIRALPVDSANEPRIRLGLGEVPVVMSVAGS